MARRHPAHHFRRGNIFYFRIVIPDDLKPHFPTRELCFSLHTEVSAIAARYAAEFSAMIASFFITARSTSSMSDAENTQHLLDIIKAKSKALRQQEAYEQRESLFIDALAQRARDIQHLQASHTTAIAQQQQTHALTIAEMATKHALTTAEIAAKAAAAPAPAKPTMLLSEAIEYVRKIAVLHGDWTAKTENENLSIYALVIRVIGDKPLTEINYQDVTALVETLRKLPPNINKARDTKGKSIDEIIGLNKKAISKRTAEKYMERTSSLFKTLTEPKHQSFTGISVNIFEGESKSVAGKANAAEVGRQPFSDAELSQLISHKNFQKRNFNNPYNYWLIPLALLSGARLNEMCQLHLDDFKQAEGVWCIDINDEEECKKLKTGAAKRLVPIHDELIRIGLLEYVEALKAARYDRLFPELKERRDGFGQTASNWFQRYRAKCGVTGKQEKVFHSFRHTFITRLLDDEVSSSLVAPIVGHEANLITEKVYWNKKDARKRKQSTIDKLTHFDGILALLPTIHEVTFNAHGKGTFWKNGKLTGIKI